MQSPTPLSMLTGSAPGFWRNATTVQTALSYLINPENEIKQITRMDSNTIGW